MTGRRPALLAGPLVALIVCSCGLFKDSVSWPLHQRIISEKQWSQAFSQGSGWTGGDVAASFILPGDRTLWVFGDSFIGTIEDGRRVNSTLVNNAIAVHPYDPAHPGEAPQERQLKFYWGPEDKNGKPTAWITPSPDSARSWFWPTGGGAVFAAADGDQHLALFLIRVAKQPSADSVWGFSVLGSAVAIVANVKAPEEFWEKRTQDFPGPLEWGVAAMTMPDYVLVYSLRTDAENRRELLLARVPPERFEDFSEWEFYKGQGRWQPGPDQAAAIADNLASELSVDRIERDSRPVYVMVYSAPDLGNDILVRTAAAPEGPWSLPRSVFTITETGVSKTLFAYAAKGHAPLSEPGTLLISYIVNSNDFNELLDNPLIYQPRFVGTPLKALAPR